MNKKILASVFISAFLFTGCTHVDPILEKVKLQNENKIEIKKMSAQKYTIGSTQYAAEISAIAEREGYGKALHRIMDDVEKDSGVIDRNNAECNIRLYRLVSSLIYRVGDVDMRTHYFRNKLNRAPQSLKELMLLNSRLPSEKQWRLMPAEKSLYHMQGNDGEYNLKFLSCEGFCEAVYNKDGILLTEKNDPVNMGTFNYYPGMKVPNAHMKYDVAPYLKWGNSPDSPQKNEYDIKKGTDSARKKLKQNFSQVMEYRRKNPL